jgi:hypothetical protein
MRAISALCVTVLAVVPAAAQTSYPMITHTTPVAVQRGRATEITVEGQMNFAGVTKMLVEGDGLTAEVVPPPASGNPRAPARSAKLRLTVAADATLGVREFRLASRLGVSSPGQLLVVDDPVVSESGDNNTPEKANPVPVPCVVVGRIEAVEDVDWFRVKGKAGQTLTFEVHCARLQDKIHDLQKHADPLLTLCDADGRELAANDDALFADPLLTFTVPRDGEYLVQVRDAKYDGDPRWVYALGITDRPSVSHLFPMAGNPGQTVTVEPVGSAKRVAPRAALRAPMEPGLHAVQLEVGGVRTNPTAFVVSPLPQVTEQEPNDTPAKANRVPIPCGINGRIGARRDLDHFVFAAKKGQAIRFEVQARRYGTVLCSSLDSVLDVMTPAGAVLASNDDETGKDAGLVFTPPADGDYVLRVRDLNSKGGETAVYHVEADFARPDFSLRCDPCKAMIGPGSSTAWFVHAVRTGGFAGPIAVTVEGLPKGVTASPVTITPERTVGLVVLTAAPDAAIDATNVTVRGTGPLPPGDPRGPALTRTAVGSEEIYLPGGGRGRFDVKLVSVAVTEPSDILKVDVSPAVVTLKPGEEVKLDVTITRRPDFTQSVSLDVPLRHLGGVFANPLPAGVTMVEGKSKTLVGTGTKGHIVLKAAPNAAPVENVPVCVQAFVSINFVVKIGYSSPPIPVTVRKP